jgi:hypothetical protein
MDAKILIGNFLFNNNSLSASKTQVPKASKFYELPTVQFTPKNSQPQEQ